ncbi:MAG: hypothetical protein KDI51_18920, partial [Xanthomonadales bacterium]|nr:hypothetical protein [Xanthomonadales bacterium]
MTTARSTITPPGSAGYYLCVSRFVRRAWLYGLDRQTGKSYVHRRDWLAARMNELASIFAVRVLAFAAMSNHLHLALGFDPGWVEGWTEVECLNRCLQLDCPADVPAIWPKLKAKARSAEGNTTGVSARGLHAPCGRPRTTEKRSPGTRMGGGI